jgi:hypothetical protein
LQAAVERPFSVRPPPGAFVVALLTLGALMLAWFGHATPYDNYVILARALLHGHVWVTPPGSWIDALPYNGRAYIIEGPLPAILLLPAVALWGAGTNQTILSWLLTAVATAAGWELARRLGVPVWSRVALTAFLLLGTDLFFCGVFGDVWYLAHVSAVCFTLLALVELRGRRRGWLVMLCAACAAFSRFSLATAIPVYVYLLLREASAEERRARLNGALAICGVAALLWLSYNRARWGVWYDIGYAAWYHQDQAGQPTGSPFRLAYLPMQLYSFFVMPPLLVRGWPYVVPTQWGLALPFTSPALVLAFFARRPVWLVAALWVAAALTAAPNFLYYVNGFTQFGMRHALDFEPFLFALMCLAAKDGLRWWGWALCLYSSVAGVWGVWSWLSFYRTGS